MSAPQRPLNGEQILQRIDAGATGRELIAAADAEAARDAIEAQQQNDGLDFIASSNPTDPGFPPGSVPSSTYVLGTNGWQLTMALDDIQDKYLDSGSIWLGDGGVAEPFATGATGRALIEAADAAAARDALDLGTMALETAADYGKLSGANTWTAAQRFNAAIDQRAPEGEQLLHRYVESATGEVPADSWQMRRGGAFARDIYITSSDSIDIILGRGANGLSAFRHNLAIGATSIPDGSRTLIKGGSTPGTPAGDEARFGGGVGRFGSHVSAAHYRMSTYSTTASGTLNNAPIGDAGFVRCPITGSLTITGLQGGAEGRWLILFNLSTGNSVTLAHENGSSDSANQIRTQTNADVTFSGRRSVMLMYDTGISKWIPLLFGL